MSSEETPADRGRERRVRRDYDTLAAAYAEHLFDELAGKPLDRRVLERFAARWRGRGPVCEVGCGPAQVGRYLHERGVAITGLDISLGMLRQAARRNPAIAFVQGDLAALPFADGALAGIVAFYAIVHLQAADLVRVLRELHRALRPGGELIVAFHIGTEVVHRDELWNEPVDLDFVFFETDVVVAALRQAGFAIDAVEEREPYPEVEHPSRRAYIQAFASPEVVRRATPADAADLTRIAFAAKRHWGYAPEWIEAWTTTLTIRPQYVASNPVWVATRAGEVAGWVGLLDCNDHWQIDHLWILPEHHGRGIGRRLFDVAIAHAARTRPGRVVVEADPNAAAFYERCGARRIGSVAAPVLGTARELPLLEIEVRTD